MRCPTQAAPMPPAQAEALYDLELEDGSQEARNASADRSKISRYEKPLMRGPALQPLASTEQRLQQSSVLQQSSPESVPPS
jgi:hypothetical protein